MNRLKRTIAAIAIFGVALAGCGGQATEASFELVAPPTAAAVIAQESPIVLDVRTAEEYAAGHLADAMLIDFYAVDFADQLDQLDKTAKYVVYCRSGNRSASAIETMRSLGFVDVVEIEDGIVGWMEHGLGLTDQ